MERERRFGSDGFVRFLRVLAALALLLALGGAMLLTLRAGRGVPAPAIEFGSAYAPGVLVLEPADEVGPDPFTDPVAAQLDLDPALIALPPAGRDSLDSPHRRGSAADLIAAGEFGWALVDRRDRNGRLQISSIRSVAADVLGPDGLVTGLEDIDGDGLDDDGSFTLEASDGSAVCVTPGSPRTLAIAQGSQIDVEDGAAANGLSWNPGGPCGSSTTGSPAVAETGATPGVYGATGEGEVCDPGLLASLLQANPRVAEGWATVVGVPVEDVPEFVSDLTPVVLLEDTLVTNAGWHNGKIVPRQSVLQRGTTVMVDRHGSPTVRCLSGSPLRPPQPVPAAPTFEGEAWAGFGRGHLEEIAPSAVEVPEFLLIDVQTGEPIRRTPGLSGALTAIAGPIYVVEG